MDLIAPSTRIVLTAWWTGIKKSQRNHGKGTESREEPSWTQANNEWEAAVAERTTNQHSCGKWEKSCKWLNTVGIGATSGALKWSYN